MLSKEEKTEQPNSDANVFGWVTPIISGCLLMVMGVFGSKSFSGASAGKGGKRGYGEIFTAIHPFP